jgi:carbon-monoxide dehydrogenase large subunit
VTEPASAAERYAGSRVRPVKDPRQLIGRGTFIDVTRPGMLHACFVQGPSARARVGAIAGTPR